jgi:hypothetical protein
MSKEETIRGLQRLLDEVDSWEEIKVLQSAIQYLMMIKSEKG